MEKNWYYAENRRQAGPVSCEELKALLAGRRLPADTLVWHAGLKTWQPASDFPELQGGTVQLPAESPVENLAEVDRLLPLQSEPAGESRQTVAFPTEPPRQMTAPATDWEHASLWRRFWAKLLDGCIMLLIIMIPVSFLILMVSGFLLESLDFNDGSENLFGSAIMVTMVSFFGNLFANLILQFVYNGFFLNRYGATPGKMALDIQVVRSDGSPVSFLRGGARAMAELLSSWMCYIGYLIAFFDDQKRTLHDHLCDTRVVRK